MGWRLQPGSIGGELGRFVAVLALPLIGLIAYNVYERARHDVADAESSVSRLAETAADRAQRFVEDARVTLEAVARRPLVRAMDAARCDPGLKDLLELYPRAGNFLVVNRDGRILCGAIPPPRDRVVRIRDDTLLREVLRTRSFALSRPIVGRINQRWAVAAVHPVLDSAGAVSGTLSMSIDLINWRPLPAEAGMPGHSIVTLLSGPVVIATSGDAAQWVGRDVGDSDIAARVRELGEGIVRARGADDVERIWAFKPVPGAPWTALAGIEAEHVFAPVRKRILEVAALIATAVGLAMALAVLFGRRLVRPIRDIADAVRRRSEGREDLRVPVGGPRELAAMADELNRGIERTERLAREREELLARMQMQLERMPIACLMLDSEDCVTYANPAAERMFGRSADEMAGRHPFALYVPEERQALVADIFARVRRGERVNATGESLRKDGERIQIEWVVTPLQGEDGGYFGQLAMATDVTERVRAAQRLELTQKLFAALSEVNETIVRVREREELFRQVCRVCVERIGFLVAYVSLVDEARRCIVPHVYAGHGSGFLGDLSYPLDSAEPLSATVTSEAVREKCVSVANDVEADRSRDAARPWRTRIGSKSTASFPLFQSGAVVGALSVHSDVRNFFDAQLIELLQRMADDLSFALDKMAERDQLDELTRTLEERVRRRTQELEAANQELEAFSYSVSHDLRAPVRHIDGFLRLLAKELPAPGAKAAHYLQTIATAARRMGALIDDLLTLSRTGRQPVNLQRVDLQALVRELIHEAAPDLAQRRVEWQIDDLPQVMADASLLRIVLQNLLSNALKYTRSRPVASISIQARPASDGSVEITVRDNGVGFDARFKDKLFGVFQRLHRDEDFEGTGIGLATARRIVNRHGQRIWGEGALDRGAAFTFTMTLSAQGEEP
jgi:PAS domain S-box-containing protein